MIRSFSLCPLLHNPADFLQTKNKSISKVGILVMYILNKSNIRGNTFSVIFELISC